MQRLRALIVDDEFHARENLAMMLADFCPEIEVVGSAPGVEEALAGIRQLKPDVVFLDIRMPSGSEGFDLLDSLEDKNFMVVFVTAFKDYAIQAFNANAIHYILKPIDIEDLQSAVARLLSYRDAFAGNRENFDNYHRSLQSLTDMVRNHRRPQRITLFHARGFRIVDPRNIVRLEAENNCTMLYFTDGTRYLDTKTLKVFEDTLDPENFIRVHKSHMINLDYLREYLSNEGGEAVMHDGYHVPVSRNKLSEFLAAVKRGRGDNG
jgi:two-component system LytT family response regulator